MYNHLINFIDVNKIVYKYQFRFRKSHSMNHAIISLVEKVNNAMTMTMAMTITKFILKIKTSFEAYKRYIYVQLI